MFGQLIAKSGAREDASAGLDSIEERIIADLGPRPALNPVGNAEHARLTRSLDRTRVEETKEDLALAEDEAQKHNSPVLLGLGLVAALAIETFGALLLTRALGLPPAERLPLGLALALAVIGLTAVAAHRTSGTPAQDAASSNSGWRAVIPRTLLTMVIYFAYLIVVGAITVVRLRNAGAEDATETEIVAEAALMLATSLGPAWLAHWLLVRRRPAVAAARRVRLLRRRLRQLERERLAAERAVEKIARAGAEWDRESERRRARYRAEHRLASARLTNTT